MPRFWPKIICALIFFAFLANFVVCQPIASASIFNISINNEIKMGRTVAREIEKKYGLAKDPVMQARVDAIGKRIVESCGLKDLPYTFKVLDVDEINAFALPGGFIYINKGLINYLSSDDEVAGVIGHELGHVVKRHIVHQIEKAQDLSLLSFALFQDRGLMLQNIVLSAIMAGYSRKDEQEADYLGFAHTEKAGYNPYGMLIGLQRLGEKDSKANFDLFSDHPATDVRINLMQGHLKNAKIHPYATQKDKTAKIEDRNLSLPPLYATYKGYSPFYRAEFAAGALYAASKQPDFSGDRFITDSDGIYVTIFYDDREIIVLTPQDANSNGMTLDALTETYVGAFKSWADGMQKS